jgi:NADH dehydrogenase FAD-containing subunit
VTVLDTDNCEVRITSSTFPYDILLIASGADLDYAAVPGLGPADGYTRSTFTAGEAVRAHDALARVLAFVRGVDGLANPKGFVSVTPQLTSAKFDNIYAVGVAIAIAPPEQTPVPVAVPKTGHMTELMACAAAHNIAAELKGGAKIDGLSLPTTCIADAGDTAFYLSADPFLPPRNKVIHKKGKWARYLKLAFEKYYLARIRHDWPSLHFGW